MAKHTYRRQDYDWHQSYLTDSIIRREASRTAYKKRVKARKRQRFLETHGLAFLTFVAVLASAVLLCWLAVRTF